MQKGMKVTFSPSARTYFLKKRFFKNDFVIFQKLFLKIFDKYVNINRFIKIDEGLRQEEISQYQH